MSGKRVPTAADIRAWAEVTGLGDAERDELLVTLDQLRSERTSWKDRLRYGRTPVQLEYARLYAASARFRKFQRSLSRAFSRSPNTPGRYLSTSTN